MSQAAVEQRRALIRRRKRERIGTQPPGAQGLTEEQRLMIRELMDAQMKTFDTTFSHFKDFRVGGSATMPASPNPNLIPRGQQRVVPGPRAAPGNLLELVRNANSQIPADLQIRNSESGAGICALTRPPRVFLCRLRFENLCSWVWAMGRVSEAEFPQGCWRSGLCEDRRDQGLLGCDV